MTLRAKKPQRAGAGASSSARRTGSDELQPRGGKRAHPYQQPAVAPALDVRRPVGTLAVTDRHLDDLQSELGCAEEQIEVAERIEVTEVAPIGGDSLIFAARQNLGAAQRVFDRLSHQPRESQAEELVTDQVQGAHRLLLHRIDEPHP